MTAEHQEEQPVVPAGHGVEASGPSPGEELRRAREAKGWSPELVAERLRLHPEQIRALEDDEHAAFPALIFVSGYVRNYARLLDIDPAPLLATLQPVEASTPVIRVESGAPRRRFSVDFGPVAVTATLLGIVAAVLLIWFGARSGPAPVVAEDGSPPAAAAFSVAPEEEISAPFDQSAMDEVREELVRGEQATPAAAVDDAAGSSAAELVLRFSGASWVEISDATGRRLAVRMGADGDELRLRGQAPFDVLLGNAPNVSLEYNGSPYTDIPTSRQNVANFKLGSADGE
ncbi:MAG: DUF4115 domain-containing protein [Gammaproteobacteria bacterium]|nr:DUF4115 domain-containing protein [Gammaproteobacteria bacterium]